MKKDGVFLFSNALFALFVFSIYYAQQLQGEYGKLDIIPE